jgi:hypothetical protein
LSDRARPGAWFAGEFVAALGNVLASQTGEQPQLSCTPPPEEGTLATVCQEIGREHGAILWWQQGFPLPGEPVVWIGAPQSVWSRLAGHGRPAPGTEDPSRERETYLEVLRQSLEEVARSAGRLWKREVGYSPGMNMQSPLRPASSTSWKWRGRMPEPRRCW